MHTRTPREHRPPATTDCTIARAAAFVASCGAGVAMGAVAELPRPGCQKDVVPAAPVSRIKFTKKKFHISNYGRIRIIPTSPRNPGRAAEKGTMILRAIPAVGKICVIIFKSKADAFKRNNADAFKRNSNTDAPKRNSNADAPKRNSNAD